MYFCFYASSWAGPVRAAVSPRLRDAYHRMWGRTRGEMTVRASGGAGSCEPMVTRLYLKKGKRNLVELPTVSYPERGMSATFTVPERCRLLFWLLDGRPLNAPGSEWSAGGERHCNLVIDVDVQPFRLYVEVHDLHQALQTPEVFD